MSTDFSKLSTSTAGKIALEQGWLKGQILPSKHHEITVGLCGSSHGLKRHLVNNRRYGFKDDQQVIVDNQLQVIEALRPLIPTGVKLVHADFLETVRIILAKRRIGFVDFDGTQAIGKNHFDLIKLCFDSKRVRQLLIVVPHRVDAKNVDYCLSMAEQMNLPFGRHRKIVPAKDRPPGYCSNYQKKFFKRPGPKDTLLAYASLFGKMEQTSYQGVGPMSAIFITF